MKIVLGEIRFANLAKAMARAGLLSFLLQVLIRSVDFQSSEKFIQNGSEYSCSFEVTEVEL